MSNTKKFFIIIASAIAIPFLKMGKVFAEVPLPSANGQIPQAMYGVPSSNSVRYANILSFVLLIIVLPIFIILGIIALVNLNDAKKKQRVNPSMDNEKNIMKETKKLKRMILLIIITIIGILGLIGISKVLDGIYISNTVDIIVTNVLICIVLIPPIAYYVISRIKLLRSIQPTQNQMNQNQNQQNNIQK